MHAGERAELVWEHSGIRISLPVICLEAGKVGDWVRVRTRNQESLILHAQVSSASQLRIGKPAAGKDKK